MAQWIKTPDNMYIPIFAVVLAYVAEHDFDNKFYIHVQTVTGIQPVRGPFDTQALAQAALDTYIAGAGGS